MTDLKVSRGGFFAAVLALITAKLARAQNTVITPCRPKLRWGDQLPLCNGQCPNDGCDYMAPPFPARLSRADMPEQVKLGMIVWKHDGFIQDGFIAEDDMWIASHRINRCPKCSTAYWQDPTPTQNQP